jgi:hypothetical protein
MQEINGLKSILKVIGTKFGTEVKLYIEEELKKGLAGANSISEEQFKAVEGRINALSKMFDGDVDDEYSIENLIGFITDLKTAADKNTQDIDALDSRLSKNDKATEQIKIDLEKLIADEKKAREDALVVVDSKLADLEDKVGSLSSDTGLADFKKEFDEIKTTTDSKIGKNSTDIADTLKKLTDLDNKLTSAIKEATTLTSDDIDEVTLDFRAALRGTVQATTSIKPVGSGSKDTESGDGSASDGLIL